MGADAVYANNDNRGYCFERGIATCLARKGPRPKQDRHNTTRRIIGNLRPTFMGGCFATQKHPYGLGRIAARFQRSETLMLFFGIHMTNAAILETRQLDKPKENPQKKRA